MAKSLHMPICPRFVFLGYSINFKGVKFGTTWLI